MWLLCMVSMSALCACATASVNEEPVLYYFGLEESERGLPACGERQACSAYFLRYWRAPALVRLCRCARRQRCDTPAPLDRRVELNNRAYFQFCQVTTDWPQCGIGEAPLTVKSSYDRIPNPDQIEELHHQNVKLSPPEITLRCRCRNPNYWKFFSTFEDVSVYKCASLPLCDTGEFCGNIDFELYALYQTCLCPKNHMCVHNGGFTNLHISELLYKGKGWKAYCQRIDNDYSYED